MTPPQDATAARFPTAADTCFKSQLADRPAAATPARVQIAPGAADYAASALTNNLMVILWWLAVGVLIVLLTGTAMPTSGLAPAIKTGQDAQSVLPLEPTPAAGLMGHPAPTTYLPPTHMPAMLRPTG
ncbi:MAG: hypothetical protein NT169_21040 [Chloroflexi bacterium]|nr:hypothetical protein [Chloroflexota bacterium]